MAQKFQLQGSLLESGHFMWPGYHKMAQSGPELVAEASTCEQGDTSAETTLLGSHGKHQSLNRPDELYDSDPTPGYVRCFQVTSWMGLHGTGKPSLSSWHVVAPDVALSKAKPQICSEPSIFKRFGAWSWAQWSKWKCIHEVQMGRFSSCSCLSAVPVYI